jgi:hypothetical protein
MEDLKMDYERHKEVGVFLKNLNDELVHEECSSLPKSRNKKCRDYGLAIKYLKLEECFFRDCPEKADVNIYYGDVGRIKR